MLKRIGVTEIFQPKSFPADPSFRSGSVDWSEDVNLSIPEQDLQVLNETDWYSEVPRESWEIASRYFDIAFMIFLDSNVLLGAAKYFTGAVIWRAYGLNLGYRYHDTLRLTLDRPSALAIKKLGRRFFFGEAYSHIADKEPDYIRSRRCFLPLGLGDTSISEGWEGSNARMLFVCPDIGFNAYYKDIYERFKADFGHLAHSVGGAQPVSVDDPDVLGYVSNEEHESNMRQYRVMFYHSQEPNHIHYHPFEAVRAGMPLVFMSGGMLDRMGGKSLPGRCETVQAARKKLRRILDGDWRLIERIKKSQTILLEPMMPGNCEADWRQAFSVVEQQLTAARAEQLVRPKKHKPKRVAVVLPDAYRGGTLRGALLIASALHHGSRAVGEDADIVFLHPEDDAYNSADSFEELADGIAVRTFRWKKLTADEAKRTMRYAGFSNWEPTHSSYTIPDDGIAQLKDCDFWLFVSDRLDSPVLPLKPFGVAIYDYLQRYERILPGTMDKPFITLAQASKRVFVTTEFTYQDALQYAGVSSENLRKVPMLIPDFKAGAMGDGASKREYFLWTTNSAPHKNHANAAEALRIYYEELGGSLNCWVTGVNSENLLSLDAEHIQAARKIFDQGKILNKRVKFKGELTDSKYKRALSRSRFLWHPGRIDNGTFSVIEAARLGVPSLSSRYPAMEEINDQFFLNLSWMKSEDPREMAVQLRKMEEDCGSRRSLLPGEGVWSENSVEALASAYWLEVRRCL